MSRDTFQCEIYLFPLNLKHFYLTIYLSDINMETKNVRARRMLRNDVATQSPQYAHKDT